MKCSECNSFLGRFLLRILEGLRPGEVQEVQYQWQLDEWVVGCGPERRECCGLGGQLYLQDGVSN